MPLASTLNGIRREIVARLSPALGIAKTHISPPRLEAQNADFPYLIVSLRQLRETPSAGGVSTIAWLAAFDITYVGRAIESYEVSEERKITISDTIKSVLMTEAQFGSLAYSPAIDMMTFDTFETESKSWQFAVTVHFKCIVEEEILSP